MPLTKEEIRVVRLIEFYFGYIWNFPIQWNFPFYSQPKLCKAISYTFALFVFALYAFFSLASAIYINWFEDQHLQMAMIFMAGVSIVILTVLICSILILSKRFILFLEHILQIADWVHAGEKLLQNFGYG